MPETFARRIKAFRRWMEQRGLDAFVTGHPANVLYLCGFTGSPGALVVGHTWAVLVTDGRYTTQAREECQGVRVVIHRGSPLAAVSRVLGGHFVRKASGRQRPRVGFEEEYISISEMRHLRGPCPRVVSWKPHSSAVEALRAVKDEGEANCLKEAAGLACRVLMETLPLVKPGAMELDIAAEIDYRMRRLGASGPAFETIVASGARSALPHARPTSKRLRKNELVVLDLGAILRHYSSDLTRTVYLGRPPGRVQRLFQAVREAQSAAIAAIRPGATGAEVDGVARRVLEGHRLAHYFTHSLGHGIGLEIHEAPRLAAGVKQPLVAGNVLTVEPGVYLPGFGGFRIEDDVLITPGGAEVLTRSLPEIVEP